MTVEESELVSRAQKGDGAAVEQLLQKSSELVYRLAVRMLGDPDDAQDASQEILLRVAGALPAFRGESAFRTWVYRIASNYLLTARKRKAEEQAKTFAEIGAFLDVSVAANLPPIEDQMILTEAKLTCNARMLLCLDRDHRLAFILGEILELTSDEGAEILEISSDAFRKRLSRARDRMEEFTSQNCGIVNASNPCRCGKVAANARAHGALTQLRWANQPALPKVEQIDELRSAVELFRSHPDYQAPEALMRGVRELLQATGHAQAP
jgi:RNA polymerase sigma factor (sigma-70 family)